MASIIAGHGHGFGAQDGIIGVAPEARILSVRVIPDRDDPGYSSYEREQEDGFRTRWRRASGTPSITVRVSSARPSARRAEARDVRSALQYGYGHGVVVVASSGNSGEHVHRQRNGYVSLKFLVDHPA